MRCAGAGSPAMRQSWSASPMAAFLTVTLSPGGVDRLRAAAQGDRLEALCLLAERKTTRSRRQVALTDPAVAALRRHRRAHPAERLAAGPGWHDHGLVFANAAGAPIEARNLLTRSFRPSPPAGRAPVGAVP